MFPPLALLCTAGIFLVYGFRPELLPLLLCVLITNIANFPALCGVIFGLHNTDYREQGVLLFFVFFLMLSFSIFVGLYFSPLEPQDLLKEDIYTINLNDGDKEYFVRVYDPKTEAEKLNVIFVVPPVVGSMPSVDLLCGTLRDSGFRVVTYSNKSFDIPSVNDKGKFYLPTFSIITTVIKAANKPYLYKNANDAYCELEENRKGDLIFLLEFINSLTRSKQTSIEKDNSARGNFFIVAYNEGSGALLKNINNIFNSDETDAAQNINGIVAIETLMASNYLSDRSKDVEEVLANTFFGRVKKQFTSIVSIIKPKKISFYDKVPALDIPVLFLMSDKINNAENSVRYAAVTQTIKNNPAFVSLKSPQGFGPLDYSDIPQKYPIMKFLFKSEDGKDNTTDTVSGIILQFISSNMIN